MKYNLEMIELPFFVYALIDELTLKEYSENSTSPSVEMMKLRTLRKARSYNQYLPDFVYQNRSKYDEQETYNELILSSNLDICSEIKDNEINKKLETFSFYLVNGLKKMAKRYLHKINDKLYVRKEFHEEWKEVMQLCPPLLICSAYYLDEFKSCSDKKLFFNQVLAMQFLDTALIEPYVYDLKNIVDQESKLSDLHVHLNGCTETDMLWWSQIGYVEEWIYSFRKQYYRDSKVFQQYEQEVGSVNSFCNNLRTGKRLIDEIALLFIDNDEIFREKWQFIFAYKEYPILAKAAYFFLLILSEIETINDFLAHKFHHLILIITNLHRMIVQQKTQKGFFQFQMIPNNDIRWFMENKGYEERFKQLFKGDDLRFLEYLEGRFAPLNSREENIKLVRKINKEFKSICKLKNEKDNSLKLGLVAHFIKSPDSKDPNLERHHRLRREIRNKSYALISAQRYLDFDKELKGIVGIDAASNEMDAGPEVFAPTFRWLRTEWANIFKRDLKQTFHAGEDFVHLLSGLRMMYEAVEFLDMQQGDRIGHGTAAGIEPELWLSRLGDFVYMKRGEWLDDLIFVYSLLSENSMPYENLRLKLPSIIAEINRYSSAIYYAYLNIDDLIKAWFFRKYNPSYYLKKIKTTQKDTSDVQSKVKNELKNNYIAKEIYTSYHFNKKSKDEYNKLIEVPLKKGLFTVEELRQIQNLVLHHIAKKNIVLEVPITSNLCISFYKSLEEHHIGRWIKGSSDGNLLVPAIVLGSDDPGIFMTNIYIEYARLMTYLEEKGYNINDRTEKVLQLNRMSRFYRFSYDVKD